jgi:hypothetical protein
MPEHALVNDYTVAYGRLSVKLRRWLYLPTPENPRLEASRMRIEAIETSGGLPKELFVWERHIVYAEAQPENKDRVLCVAKVSDLSVYPVDNPDTRSETPPFYRTAVFDLPFDSPDDLTTTWNDILLSFQQLLKALSDLGLIHEPGS